MVVVLTNSAWCPTVLDLIRDASGNGHQPALRSACIERIRGRLTS